MNSLLATLSPQHCVEPAPIPYHDARSWQPRIVPQQGVVLSSGKFTSQRDLRNLALDELEIVHRLADAINTESARRIKAVLTDLNVTAEVLEPLLAALNLELAVTGRKKKYVVIENAVVKARTFSGGVVFQQSFAR